MISDVLDYIKSGKILKEKVYVTKIKKVNSIYGSYEIVINFIDNDDRSRSYSKIFKRKKTAINYLIKAKKIIN